VCVGVCVDGWVCMWVVWGGGERMLCMLCVEERGRGGHGVRLGYVLGGGKKVGLMRSVLGQEHGFGP
jgi:hypothetical protein